MLIRYDDISPCFFVTLMFFMPPPLPAVDGYFFFLAACCYTLMRAYRRRLYAHVAYACRQPYIFRYMLRVVFTARAMALSRYDATMPRQYAHAAICRRRKVIPPLLTLLLPRMAFTLPPDAGAVAMMLCCLLLMALRAICLFFRYAP